MAKFDLKWKIAPVRTPRRCVVKFVDKYLKKGWRVLDFGCGEGRHLEYMVNKGIDAIGIDHSEEGVKKTNARFNGEEKAFVGDITAPFLRTIGFDAIVCNRVIEYHSSEVIGEIFVSMNAILNDGGYAFLATRSNKQKPKDYENLVLENQYGGLDYDTGSGTIQHYFSREEIIALCKASGFDIISMKMREVEAAAKYEWQIVLRKRHEDLH